MNLPGLLIQFFILFQLTFISECLLDDYVRSIRKYVGLATEEETEKKFDSQIYADKIPYEVSTTDEKFITEAAKLTGVALSELDSCQQRVVLKLKMECSKMDDEQVAKMAVHLLNCQSYVEGRRIYPCTEDMKIKDCTKDMDSDTWTSYHLMSNRARAVCYAIRQIQFRGLAEHTVNRLMTGAREQIDTLEKLTAKQESLQNLAEVTFDSIEKGQNRLTEQQQNLLRAQFQSQLEIEDNIKRLIEEKKIALNAHNDLMGMIYSIQEKLRASSEDLKNQNIENKLNHEEIINDLNIIREQAEIFRQQYEVTLKSLKEVNETVSNLVSLVSGTKDLVDEKLSWIIEALGGTDLVVEKIFTILWHFVFILFAMLCCSFLSARLTTKLMVILMPIINILLAFYGDNQHFTPGTLGASLGLFVLLQNLLHLSLYLISEKKLALGWNKKKALQEPALPESTNNLDEKDEETDRFNHNTSFDYHEDFRSITPPSTRFSSRSNTPLRLNNSMKQVCSATTRAGTPCKLAATPGRFYCYRHLSGGSVVG